MAWAAHDPAARGGQCGQAVDGQPGHGQALAILSNRTRAFRALTPARWDAASATNFFEWLNLSASADSAWRRHELWFETPKSFGMKCREGRGRPT